MFHMFSCYFLGSSEVEVASHILQFIFVGNEGFRFPFAFFPTKEATPSALLVNVLQAINALNSNNFDTIYLCFDGGESNRKLISIMTADPSATDYTVLNRVTGEPLVLMMDPQVMICGALFKNTD